MDKIDILSLNIEEMKTLLTDMGEKAFRAKQIFNWLHKKQAASFDEMSNLSKDLRQKLSDKCEIKTLKIVQKLVSKEDSTSKYLFETDDGNLIESVLMKYSYGNAVCISSQVGCRMGCTFCASTLDGLERNLTAGEMLSQIYAIQKDSEERVGSVVIMGSGEPLDNFDNLLKFLDLVHSPEGLELGHRHITVSTCGLVEKIYELAEKMLQINLAVSLHAPNDEIRQRTMPIARKYPINELISAAKAYGNKTNRRVTYEYALIKDINDSEECARELAKRLKGSLCHVNLIPVNDVKERNYERSLENTISEFAEVLTSLGIETTVRRKLGSDINAACGQLRRGYKNQNWGEIIW